MQRKLTLGVLIGLGLLSLVGCESTIKSKTKNIHLSYFKDEHEICYAATSSASFGINFIVSIATVPCEKVGL